MKFYQEYFIKCFECKFGSSYHGKRDEKSLSLIRKSLENGFLPHEYSDICYYAFSSVNYGFSFLNYLLLPTYEEDMPYLIDSLRCGSVYAYVFNALCPELSECGFIRIDSSSFGLRRLS